jgi:DNA-binding Lrp family transcriptional regulator
MQPFTLRQLVETLHANPGRTAEYYAQRLNADPAKVREAFKKLVDAGIIDSRKLTM